MRITGLAPTKRGRFALSVDGEYRASLDELTVLEYHLRAGMELEEAALEEVLRVSAERAARDKAMRLLGYRDHTAKELRDKLLRQNDEASADAAVRRMQELGMVDDASYARRLAADLFSLKYYGVRRVRQELRRRGVEDALIEAAVADPPDPREQIEALLAGKLRGVPHDQKGRKKLSDRLAALGYDWDDIRAALDGWVQEDAPEAD